MLVYLFWYFCFFLCFRALFVYYGILKVHRIPFYPAPTNLRDRANDENDN